MRETFAHIVGHGKLFIRDEIIEFENKVTANFLVAPQYMLDRSGLTKQGNQSYEPDWNSMNKFSVLAETPESSMSKVYTDMGSFASSAFNLIQASLTKSILRGSGIITKTGTIQSAGFNVATLLPSAIIPYVPVPWRRSVISLVGATTVSVQSGWVYYAAKKALYNFSGTSIYKIPYDHETGVLGTETLISNNFTGPSVSRFNFTDGKSRLFRQFNSTLMKMFDMDTDIVTDITLSESVVQIGYGIAWSESEGLIRSYYDTGFTISTNGTVTRNTGGRNSTWLNEILYMIRNDYVVVGSGFWGHANISTPNVARFNASFGISSHQYFPDNDKNIVTVDFPNASPATMTVHNRREPDTSYTIIAIPSVNVTTGESFGIEYTFTVTDGR